MADVVDGACLCGAVSFRVGLPVKWVAHCHCTMCRRAHGAALVTWVGAHADRFDVVAGAEHVVRYASSSAASREHCGRCGSPLFFRGDRWPDEVHIARALIVDDDGLLPVPQAHVFFGDKVEWLTIHDELPRRGGPSGMEPLS